MKLLVAGAFLFFGLNAGAAVSAQSLQGHNDVLVKFKTTKEAARYTGEARKQGARVESLGGDNLWLQVRFPNTFAAGALASLASQNGVVAMEPNREVRLIEDYRAKNPADRARLSRLAASVSLMAPPDNPAFPVTRSGGSGSDPNFGNQWGMNDIGVKNAWSAGRGKNILVAVIDTGVDYTHEDLVDNMYRNPGEMGLDSSGRDKSSNGVDDDNNGFVDDVMGWDFASNDNKPYDLSVDPIQILMGGGNPGHGTHCAGNVAAVADNGKGVAGVAPDAKILPIRFLNEKGSGDIAAAVKSINYAVQMGARVLSNSWGSEGDDGGANEVRALKDAIDAAEKKGVLFVAAAGNGHQGVGYDNDTDAKPGYPASYSQDNIVSVAALDSKDALGAFSNWGIKTVDIGAPGVVVYSTTVGGQYSDTVVDMYGIKATWDGTSMACPHVAGAAAAWLSKHPEASYREVKAALLSSVKPVAGLKSKILSGGKLNVEQLMRN
jgi:thermitase